MALQSFFSSFSKSTRKTPATVSGRFVSGEFRMRKDGTSIQIVKVDGVSEGKDLEVAVQVFDPDGVKVFDKKFKTKA